MNVKELIEVLEKIEDKENVDVYFSYDSRVCVPYVNVVDFVDDGSSQDQRVSANMFMEGYEKPEERKAIILRSEDWGEYTFQHPQVDEETYRKQITEEAWDENLEWSRLWYIKNYRHDLTTDEEIKKEIEKDIEQDMKYYRSHVEETKDVVNLFFEGR